MANPEQGKSSSSPSAKISSLSKEGADGSVLRVRLDDGSLFLLDDPSAAQAAEACLNAVDFVSADLRGILKAADEAYRCRRKALDLLARAEQCRKGLEAKLAKKGFTREAAAHALDRLEASGYLDDGRFAEAWVRSRLRSRPEGRTRLIAGLMAKGISGDTARNATETVLSESGDADTAEREALERARKKLFRRSGMNEEKLIAALLRRGFSYTTIKAASEWCEKDAVKESGDNKGDLSLSD